jgi:triosephosphate isomerase
MIAILTFKERFMPMKSSPPLIIANWKMYKTLHEAEDFIKKTTPAVEKSGAEIALAVPFTLIREVSKAAAATPIRVGAQNMNDASEGAFTGEVSALMLKDAGASFVLLGHSERRGYFQESDAFINRKVRRALSEGLQVILCIGESYEDHNEGKIREKLASQILGSLEEIDSKYFSNIVIAYEPVWAIGTGKAATSEEVSEESDVIREIIAEKWGKEVSLSLKVLYGGSVSPDNAKTYLSKKNINGLLIGSASLNVDSFGKIISEI